MLASRVRTHVGYFHLKLAARRLFPQVFMTTISYHLLRLPFSLTMASIWCVTLYLVCTFFCSSFQGIWIPPYGIVLLLSVVPQPARSCLHKSTENNVSVGFEPGCSTLTILSYIIFYSSLSCLVAIVANLTRALARYYFISSFGLYWSRLYIHT